MSKARRTLGLLCTSALMFGIFGCGGSRTDFIATGQGEIGSQPVSQQFVVTEPGPIEIDGFLVDSLELEAFDADGNRLIFENVLAQGDAESVQHVVVPFSQEMVFPPLPEGTETVELDYLRNRGYTLARALEKVDPGQSLLENPDEQVAERSSSSWTLEQDQDGGFTLRLLKSVVGERIVRSNFIIKGICYSPTPINVLGDGAPNIGDFFFDPVKNPNTGQTDFFNWYGLWGFGSLGDGFFARDDLKTIRGLNANTIRVYSMLSRQQNDPETNPGVPEFPDPTSVTHHQHKEFLDRCWNNGRDPIFVIVGIPLPPDNLYLGLQGNTPPKIAFYDHVLRETIADLADHPAVLGFTIQNEINDGADAFPNGSGGQMAADDISTGAQTERSDFYWGKIKEHSDYAKEKAPDKLVGACFHDFREIAQYASHFPKEGPTYLEQASNLDFVGINTYQTQNYNDQFQHGWGAVTGPGRKAVLFSELGFPATTRDGDDPATIKDTPESRQNTAEFVARMLPQAYSNSVTIGACYFSFSDEWWKQIDNTKEVVRNGQVKVVRAVDEWYGGHRASGFPNGWWDEEGFGLFSVARYPGLQNSDPVMVNVNGFDIGPDRRLDRLTERKEITKVVREFFDSIPSD